MKTFIIFVAVVAVACANNVARSSGWGSPAAPSIDLELSGAAAAAGSGQAAGNQAVLELVSGNADSPASLSNANGLGGVGLVQGEDLSQIQIANKPDGATATINTADVYNEAVATDSLDATLIGGIAASVVNAANTDASGQGAIAAEASSLNIVQS